MKLKEKIAVVLFGFAVAAQGHVSVSPQQSKTGATEHYLVRVPTEGSVSTVSVDLEVPAGVTVGEIAAPSGAKYEVTRDGGRVTSIKWTIEIKPGNWRSYLSPRRTLPTAPPLSGRRISTLSMALPKIGSPQLSWQALPR